MTDPNHSATRIAVARQGLADKLGELERRGARLRAVFSPSSYLTSPWLRVGLGIGVGYALGRRGRTRPVSSDSTARDSIFKMLVRSTVLTIVETAIRRAIDSTGRE